MLNWVKKNIHVEKITLKFFGKNKKVFMCETVIL